MKRPGSSSARVAPNWHSAPRGYTLIEILVATTLTLIMMAAVVQIFGLVGESVSDSRSMVEMNDRLRATVARLQLDLEGVTVTMLPPRAPAEDEGYFEYIEGGLGVTITNIGSIAKDANGANDTTVADFDDILMFTTRSLGKPFVGRFYDTTQNRAVPVESPVAEVAWFVRGGNLYRRVLLVLPSQNLTGFSPTGFYAGNDISVRREGNRVVANTLGELTKRENRYAHPTNNGFPFDVRGWGALGLPTLSETSHSGWVLGRQASTVSVSNQIDFWNAPEPHDRALTNPPPADPEPEQRVAEDVILSHVIGFDVKAWDPKAPLLNSSGAVVGYGDYVDLGANNAVTFAYRAPSTSDPLPDPLSRLTPDLSQGKWLVYDTWSTHYEHSRFANPGNRMVNGFDDDGNGVVDDLGERIKGAPYPVPLRGIQIKIRVFEPDSRQVREVTIVQDFLPK